MLLTSPLSCLARFIVLWDIRNLSIINCEQIQTRLEMLWCKTGPVLVIKWGGRERGGGILGGWRRLEIALNRNYFLLRWLLCGLVVGWQAGLGTWTIHNQPENHPNVKQIIYSHHQSIKIGSIQFSVRASCLVWLRLLLA